MLPVFCQIQGKEVEKERKKKNTQRCVQRYRERKRKKEKTRGRKSNECMLLAEIPGARLGDSGGGKSCSFSLSD